MAQLGLQVMVAGFGSNLDFLDLESGLFFFGFLLFFGLFVFIAAIVHDFAHRRFGGGRNLNKVKAEFSSRLQGIVYGQNAKLFAVRVNYADFPFANALIDSSALCLVVFYRSEMSYADTSYVMV